MSFAGLSLSPLFATTLSFTPVADNTLYESATGALSNGEGTRLFSGLTRNGAIRRGLVRFDLSSIPAGSTIQAVTVSFNRERGGGGNNTFQLNRSLLLWGEGTSAASGQQGGGTTAGLGDATWTSTGIGSVVWSAVGGDFAASSGSAVLSGNQLDFSSSAGLISDVSGWVNDSTSNFGWVLTGDETATSSAAAFSTRESATAANQPTLSVTFEAVPEPSSALLALISLGSIAVRRTRR